MSSIYSIFLTLGLLISGVSIPLILSFQDNQKIYRDEEHSEYFNQPLLQTVTIFIGEILCILIINLVTKKPSTITLDQPIIPTTISPISKLWFVLPSLFDLIATTLLNIGLIYTTPSIYQMMKSSIVGFSAIFSSLFLSRKFIRKEWVSIVFVLIGTGLIIGTVQTNYVGPVCLIVAQLFVAGQFILEEFLMDKYQLDPVKAMSIEGLCGLIILSITLLSTVFCPYFNIKQGLIDLFNTTLLWQSALVLSFMVAIFNFFGLAISTIIGIPGRSVIDTLRTILTWVLAIHFGWDYFSWLELIGFIILVIGIFIFNGVLKTSLTGESAPLLS